MQVKVERRNDGQEHVLSVSLAVTGQAVSRFFGGGFLFFLFPRFLFCMCVFCLLAACPLWAIVLTSLCLRIHDLASYSLETYYTSLIYHLRILSIGLELACNGG